MANTHLGSLRMNTILIKKVKRHEYLYNTQLADYRDKNVREQAWEEIGRELQISGYQAKLRWERLRRCFNNARNRRRYNTKNDSARKFYWKYEKQMSFILPFFGGLKKTPEKVNHSQCSYNELVAKSDDMFEEIKVEYEDIQDDQAALNDNESDAADLDTNVEINKIHHKAVQFPKKQYDTSTGQLSDILKEYSTLRKHQYEEKKTLQTASKSTDLLGNLDDTDLFFLSMSKMTKQMPKVEQSQIKLALSNLVLSAEVRCNQALTGTGWGTEELQ